MLMWSGVLLLVLVVVAANAGIMAMGMPWGFSNRDEAANLEGWGARAKRCYMNHLENMVIFAAILLPVNLSGISNEMTVLGAQIFLGARVAHAIIYVSGITLLGLRTLAYFAGVIGTILILIQAF
eukprot:s1_g40.t1